MENKLKKKYNEIHKNTKKKKINKEIMRIVLINED